MTPDDIKKLRELRAGVDYYECIELEWRGSAYMQSQYVLDVCKAFYEAAWMAVPALLEEIEKLRSDNRRVSAQVLHLSGSLAEYEPEELTAADLEEHARLDRMTDDEVMADLTSDGVATAEDVKTWSRGAAVFARAMLAANAKLAVMTAARDEACDLAEEANGDPSSCSYVVPIGERIAALRGVGGGK